MAAFTCSVIFFEHAKAPRVRVYVHKLNIQQAFEHKFKKETEDGKTDGTCAPIRAGAAQKRENNQFRKVQQQERCEASMLGPTSPESYPGPLLETLSECLKAKKAEGGHAARPRRLKTPIHAVKIGEITQQHHIDQSRIYMFNRNAV